jgi:hypothetical protein
MERGTTAKNHASDRRTGLIETLLSGKDRSDKYAILPGMSAMGIPEEEPRRGRSLHANAGYSGTILITFQTRPGNHRAEKPPRPTKYDPIRRPFFASAAKSSSSPSLGEVVICFISWNLIRGRV